MGKYNCQKSLLLKRETFVFVNMSYMDDIILVFVMAHMLVYFFGLWFLLLCTGVFLFFFLSFFGLFLCVDVYV